MAGRHDRAADESRPGLLATGPIVVRGLTRGVRDALRSGQDSRHRSPPPLPELALSGTGDRDLITAVEQADDPGGADVTEQRPDPEAEGGADPRSGAAAPPGTRTPGEVRSPSEEAGGAASVSNSSPGARAASTTRRSRAPGGAAPDPRGGPSRTRKPLSGSGSGRRELAGVAVVVVLAVVCVALISAILVKTRADTATAAREAASYTPPPLASASSAVSRAVLAIVSDESATSSRGVAAADRWPDRLADASRSEVALRAAPDAGYVARSTTGQTFRDLAARIPAGSGVVLFVGGGADADAASLSLARAATEAFSEASQRAPGAEVVAVGPLFRPSGLDERAFTELRSTLRSSARIAGVRWVDPVSSGWLPSASAASELTSADERTISRRLLNLLNDAG